MGIFPPPSCFLLHTKVIEITSFLSHNIFFHASAVNALWFSVLHYMDFPRKWPVWSWEVLLYFWFPQKSQRKYRGFPSNLVFFLVNALLPVQCCFCYRVFHNSRLLLTCIAFVNTLFNSNDFGGIQSSVT